MVDGLVATGCLDTADEDISGIVAEGQATGVIGSPEVSVHGLSHEGGERRDGADRPGRFPGLDAWKPW